MIFASAHASSQQGLSPSDRTYSDTHGTCKSSNFILPTDPRRRNMEMKQDEVWQKRLPELKQTRSAAGR